MQVPKAESLPGLGESGSGATVRSTAVDEPQAPSSPERGNGSPAIQPGYRKGHEPANKGKRLHTVPLTRQEVEALLGALPSDRYPTGARNRATVMLMYRMGFKPKQVVEMGVHHYSRGDRRLTEPPAHAAHERSGQARVRPVDMQTR